ncbi:MAG: hypothetical protein GY805_36500 [Chloroflexi bacterium]|nr:hypothetical protein [Chloroflexota bacterium]
MEIVILFVFQFVLVAGIFWFKKKSKAKEEIAIQQKKTELKQTQIQHKYSKIIKKMAAYRIGMEKLAEENQANIHSYRLKRVLQSFDEWELHLDWLIKRLHEFESDKILKHEQSVLPSKIAKARVRLYLETDSRLQEEIQETMDSYLRQKKYLDNVNFLIEKTKLDLEEFIAGVGTIYSQLKVLKAIDIRSNRAKRLAHEIEEERLEIDDLLNALDEMYGKE